MAHTLFFIFICILSFNYLFGLLLDYLDSTRWSEELPWELKGIYDPARYRKSQSYEKANTRFSLLTGAVSFSAIMLLLIFRGFSQLDQYVRIYSDHPIVQALLFFAILGLAFDLLFTPFEAYRTFVIEENFGFNTTTLGTFVADKLKSWLIALLLGGGLLSFIVWIYGFSGNWFWFIAWMALTAFSVFMSLFYSNIIVPLFNKQKPLEPGELRNAIETFALKTGFRLKNIYLIDGSKRSRKANAYFTGLGPKKRIVLYDTLIKDLTDKEIVAVLAHETGHYKKKHVLSGLISSIIINGIMLYLMSLLIGNPVLAAALGCSQPSFHIGILAFGLLYSPISMILSIAGNYISRAHEYAADRYAAVNYDPEALKSGLLKLSVLNLSNLRPHPFTVAVTYSHPTLLQRIAAIERLEEELSVTNKP